MRMQVGSAEVGGLVEVVEFDEPGDLSWTNVTGIDQRGRWRLRETSDGRTRVTLRLSYDAPGGVLGMISDRVSAPMVGRNFERTLENLQREFEGGATELAEPGKGLTGRIGYALGSAKVLRGRRGDPADPAGQARQGAHHAGPLRPQPGRGHDLARRPLPRRDDDRRRARHAHVRRGPPAHQRPRARALRRRDQGGRRRGDHVPQPPRLHRVDRGRVEARRATRSTSTPPSPGPS